MIYLLIIVVFVSTVLFYVAYSIDKNIWNGGICKESGATWKLYDRDSQAGRMYEDKEGHSCDISWPVDWRYTLKETGYYDKNGKEILGGDRLRVRDGIFIAEARENGYVILDVVWNNVEKEWQMVSEKVFLSDIDGKPTHSINTLNALWKEDIEVIGNIYQ